MSSVGTISAWEASRIRLRVTPLLALTPESMLGLGKKIVDVRWTGNTNEWEAPASSLYIL